MTDLAKLSDEELVESFGYKSWAEEESSEAEPPIANDLKVEILRRMKLSRASTSLSMPRKMFAS
jgi:hypothetical protein